MSSPSFWFLSHFAGETHPCIWRKWRSRYRYRGEPASPSSARHLRPILEWGLSSDSRLSSRKACWSPDKWSTTPAYRRFSSPASSRGRLFVGRRRKRHLEGSPGVLYPRWHCKRWCIWKRRRICTRKPGHLPRNRLPDIANETTDLSSDSSRSPSRPVMKKPCFLLSIICFESSVILFSIHYE